MKTNYLILFTSFVFEKELFITSIFRSNFVDLLLFFIELFSLNCMELFSKVNIFLA